MYTASVTSKEAIRTIRLCVQADRVIVKEHCVQRLAERGFFWGDVLVLMESPAQIRGDGDDEFGRNRWFVAGKIAGRHSAELLCVIDRAGPTTVFITVYWED